MSLYLLCNQDIDTSFFTLEMTWRGIRDSRIAQQIGVTTPRLFEEVIKGTTINTFIEKDPFPHFIHVCANALLEKSDLLAELKKQTLTCTKNMQDYAREMIARVDELSDKEIEAFFLKARDMQTDAAAYGTVVAFADVLGSITERMNAVLQLRKEAKLPLHVYSQILSTAHEKSLTEQAYEDIVSSNASDEELAQRYFWLHQGYIGRGLVVGDVAEIRSHQRIFPQASCTEQEAIADLQLTPEEMRVFLVARDVMIIKSLRADSRQFLHVVLNRVLDRLVARWNVPVQLLESLSVPEIVEYLRNGTQPTEDVLRALWTHSVRIPRSLDDYETLLNDEVQQYTKTNLYREHIADRSEVRGQVANPGKVSGRVRLVFGPQHNDKVEEGDILLSTATSPQLLPAMKRAAAFVTDVGGITSHAAIVARELGKPCIVGTKHATEIFNDGDEVEVDAEKGIVRILQQK